METRNCDLCGESGRLTLPRLVTFPNRVCVCKGCGVMRTDPVWSDVEIRDIYEQDFREDPMSPQMFCLLSDRKREAAYYHQRQKMARYVLPLLARHRDLEGARVLDVRSQFGGLAAELKQAGANVQCVDLFPDGIEWLQSRVGVAATLSNSPSQLLAALTGPFDAITMMTVHTPAHAPSPMALLRDAHRLLVPDGILVVEEKDIRRLSWLRGRFPLRASFRRAGVHYYHFTKESLRRFVVDAGFEIEAEEWLPYSSSLRRFCIVARKSTVAAAPGAESGVVHRPYAMYAYPYYLLLKSAVIKPVRVTYKRLANGMLPRPLKGFLKSRLPRLTTWARRA